MTEQGNKQAQVFRVEPRWPVALTTAIVIILVIMIKNSIRIFPFWIHYLVTFLVLASLVAISLSRASTIARQIERFNIFLLFIIIETGVLGGLYTLISEMISSTSSLSGIELLGSSVVVWFTNILMFSLVYWQTDRKGPEARINSFGGKPDWLFPQTGVPEFVPSDWYPSYVDYLFLAFTTAIAFSPTDVMPLNARAKMLMMVESVISFTTILVVLSRAVGTLGS